MLLNKLGKMVASVVDGAKKALEGLMPDTGGLGIPQPATSAA